MSNKKVFDKEVYHPFVIQYKTVTRRVILVGALEDMSLYIGHSLKNSDGLDIDDDLGKNIAVGRAIKQNSRLNTSFDMGYLFKKFGSPKSIIKAYLEVQALRIQRDPLKYFPVLENEYKRELKAKEHETKDSK